jgi:hypothetical protein
MIRIVLILLTRDEVPEMPFSSEVEEKLLSAYLENQIHDDQTRQGETELQTLWQVD